MKTRSIPFTGPMVRAILDGRKTQTRWVVKPQPVIKYRSKRACKLVEALTQGVIDGDKTYNALPESIPTHPEHGGLIRCPYGQPGDLLWVRETFYSAGYSSKARRGLTYRADVGARCKNVRRWRPSIHMPRWASRILLEVTRVRVERVQDIGAADCLAEGIDLPIPSGCNIARPPDDCSDWPDAKKDEWIEGQARATYFTRCADAQNHIDTFRDLWDSINAKRDHGWDKNPWVWVVEFKVKGSD